MTPRAGAIAIHRAIFDCDPSEGIEMDLYIQAANACFAAMRAHWLPIETAPKDGTTVLIHLAAQGRWPAHYEVARYVDGYWWNTSDLGFASAATHWLPIPARSHPKAQRQIEERSDTASLSNETEA